MTFIDDAANGQNKTIINNNNNETKLEPLKPTESLSRSKSLNESPLHRIDRLLYNKSSEEIFFLPNKNKKKPVNLKYSYVQLSADFEPLNSQPEPEFDKTLNEIKKTRQELVEEYKSMMHMQQNNGQQTPPVPFRHEPICFGHNVKFLRTNANTHLKRPRFEDTLHILLKNKSFYRDNKN